MEIKLVDTTIRHIEELYRHLRISDLIELKATAGFVSKELIERSVKSSVWVKSALTPSNQTIAIGGIMKVPDATEYAAIWMLGTSLVSKYPYSFAHLPLLAIKAAQENDVKTLFNYVYGKNTTSLRWLKINGFSIAPKSPFGKEKKLFHYVEKRL